MLSEDRNRNEGEDVSKEQAERALHILRIVIFVAIMMWLLSLRG